LLPEWDRNSCNLALVVDTKDWTRSNFHSARKDAWDFLLFGS